ncbi:hypothetical protein E2I00_015807, partial [Balaenoptera physalus]
MEDVSRAPSWQVRTGKCFAEQILRPSPPRLPVSGAPFSLPTCCRCWKLPPAMPGLALLGLVAVLGVRAGALLCLFRQLSWPGHYVLGGSSPLGSAEDALVPWAALGAGHDDGRGGDQQRVHPDPQAAPGLQPPRHVLGARGRCEARLGVSYGASTDWLSSRNTFPSFFRTVPSDRVQAAARVELLRELHWTWVAAVGSDDEYSRQGLSLFFGLADAKSTCIAHKGRVPLPGAGSPRLGSVQGLLRRRAGGVVFSSACAARTLFSYSIHYRLSPKVWVASEAWLPSNLVMTLPGMDRVGTVLGVPRQGAQMPEFPSYVRTRLALATAPAYCASPDAGQPGLEEHVVEPRCPHPWFGPRGGPQACSAWASSASASSCFPAGPALPAAWPSRRCTTSRSPAAGAHPSCRRLRSLWGQSCRRAGQTSSAAACGALAGTFPPEAATGWQVPPTEALVHCHVHSWVSFGLVHATNATLAFLCFLGTFLVKSQPGGYNGAHGLTFAMLAYFITWVSFVPLFANVHVVSQPAVQMGAILFCVLGILGTFHLP